MTTYSSSATTIRSLLDIAILLTNAGLRALPLKRDKNGKLIPTIKWKDFREVPLTEAEINEWFKPDKNGNIKAEWIGYPLRGKDIKLLCMDLDDKYAIEVFFYEFLPLFPEEVRNGFYETTRTQTPRNGLHLLIEQDPYDSPEIIKQEGKWSSITIEGPQGQGQEHSQINLLGTENMTREYGNGYSSIIDFEHRVRLKKSIIKEIILPKLEQFKIETGIIRIASDVLKLLWKSPDRDEIVFACSGFLGKTGGVPRNLTIRLFNHIMRVTNLSDENKEHTISVINDTYDKIENGEIVTGRDRILSAVKKSVIVNEIQSCFKQLGYFAEFYNGSYYGAGEKEARAAEETNKGEEDESTTTDGTELFWLPAETKEALDKHVWTITCYHPKTVIIAHSNLNKIVEARIPTSSTRNKKTGEEILAYSILIKTIHLHAIPLEITKHEDPLNPSQLDHKYSIKFRTATGQIFSTHGPSTLEAIMADLNNRALVASEFGAKNALTNIINAFAATNRLKINKEIQTPGFFIVDNKLQSCRINLKEHTKEEIISACDFLTKLVTEKHFRKEIPATSIKWGMIGVFDFALKQYTNDVYWIPWLAICGFPRSGKGTQGKIAAGLWTDYGSNKYSIPYTSVNTEARLAKKLGLDTLIFTISETHDLNSKYSTHMVEMIKTSIETRIARSKYINPTLYIDELALRIGVLTSNPDFPIETGFRSKIIRIVYTKEDKFWDDEKKKEFDSFMYNGSKHLRTLGDFTGIYVLNNPQVLFKTKAEECDWKKTSVFILEEFYKSAGLIVPEWVSLFVEETDVTVKAIEETNEANYFELRGFFETAVNEAYRLDPIRDSITGYLRAATFLEKLDHCLSHRLIPYLHKRVKRYRKDNKTQQEEIIITHDVIAALKKAHIVNIGTMQILASNIPGLEYDKVDLSDGTKRVVYGPYTEFTRFLGALFSSEEEKGE